MTFTHRSECILCRGREREEGEYVSGLVIDLKMYLSRRRVPFLHPFH